ncbi:MAG: DUF1508 domain-containing protein [Spirochaetales bacterium]|nr:DUF1508 domain-containing protein [Spirochaetales bacterium]
MGKFIIKKTNTGYRFDLAASNGEVIAASQVYKSLRTCKAGIASLQRNCQVAVEDQTVDPVAAVKCPKFEVYKDKADEFRFRLRASNGQNITTSGEGYTTKSACLNGIASIGRNAVDAKIVMAED